MSENRMYLSDGTRIPFDEVEDAIRKRNRADGILGDGERLRVPMPMMDSKTVHAPLDAKYHRPHQAVLSDEQKRRSQVYQDCYDLRVSEAWRDAGMPHFHLAEHLARQSHLPSPRIETHLPLRGYESSEELHARYEERVRNAWKGGN